ncbi:MAG: hypothetical protein K2M97_00810 [Muribaculaceae bacterium]|nr:hypothetical protein [Muribaculaceae bacterium]
MRSLLYVVIMLVVAGCTYSGAQDLHGLDEAEALMQSDPAAAMAQLNGYDVAEFRDSAAMARWALLYSEALVANRYTVPTDTIVNIAIDYYGRHNLDEEFRHASRLRAILLAGEGDRDALATALYLQKEKEFMLYKERLRRAWTVLAAIALILVAAGVIAWQRRRLRIKELLNEALVAEAYTLREGLTRNQSACVELRARLQEALASRFHTIDELCQTYYESQGTATERKAIAAKVKSQIMEIKSDDGLFAEMERCVNDCRNSMLSLLRSEFPAIRPEEYRLMVYLACNLSSRTIALLLGEGIDVAYKRKSRLKARISSLELPHAHLVIKVI